MSEQEAQSDLFGQQFNGTMKEMLDNLAQIDPDDLKHLWPARLSEFYDVINHTLVTQNKQAALNEEQINQLSAIIVTAIANHFGGVSFYLPHNEKLERAVRDIKIWQAFTGHNHGELAKKYRVSEMTIRTAIANQYQLRKSKVQPSLFGDNP